ncbi:MAG: PilZ domain-containing protein [Nitrospirae bacterium]|nr:PilZ domain-containing protein [Nitrospirota bacterium]MEC4669080.1 PilZ domain-containing protein [Nitrospirota bacterium]
MELRQFPRFPVHCPIVFYRDDTRAEGTMVDVSMSGCGVESTARLAQGNYGVLLLHLPEHDPPVQVDVAVVRWAREQRCGLQFLRMRPEEKERFHRFIGTFDRKPSP